MPSSCKLFGSKKSKVPTVEFFNGHHMPLVGYGTYLANNEEELEKGVDEALKAGYRHIDTAFLYANEAVIGRVLKRWLDAGKLKREDLFIVTKLPPHGMHPSRVNHFLKLSLKNLQLDYVDLYLVHVPVGIKYVHDDVDKFPFLEGGTFDLDTTTDLEAIWKEMEKQVDAGLTKSIGISNYNSKQIERTMKIARIQPANIQVEVSIYAQLKETRATCEKYGITVCSYSTLGRPGVKETGMLDDPKIVEIAKKHNKSAAQIALKFVCQQNIVVIPKSVTPSRIQHNFQLFDFTLTDEDMKVLTSLDRGLEARIGLVANAAFGMHKHPEWPYPDDKVD